MRERLVAVHPQRAGGLFGHQQVDVSVVVEVVGGRNRNRAGVRARLADECEVLRVEVEAVGRDRRHVAQHQRLAAGALRDREVVEPVSVEVGRDHRVRAARAQVERQPGARRPQDRQRLRRGGGAVQPSDAVGHRSHVAQHGDRIGRGADRERAEQRAVEVADRQRRRAQDRDLRAGGPVPLERRKLDGWRAEGPLNGLRGAERIQQRDQVHARAPERQRVLDSIAVDVRDAQLQR